jgi:hypothetical protein
MLLYLFTALALLAPNQAEFKTEQVAILVDIQSNIFQYNITNLASSPVVYFEVNHHAAYNFEVPEGWHKEHSSDIFKAWTDDPQSAIGPDKTAEFSMRVSSRGAVLTRAPVKIQFLSGQTSIVPAVWCPAPEPKSYVFLIAGLFLFIILLHTIVLVRKDRWRIPKAH